MTAAAQQNDSWQTCLAILRPALLLAPRTYLDDVRERLSAEGITNSVRAHNTAALYDWIVWLLSRQGISNHAAEVFLRRHGSPTFSDVSARMATEARCPRLRSYWHYADCGYRRAASTCGTPHHLFGCPVAAIPARKGSLAEAAVALWLFIRDVCGGDFVAWIDARLEAADMDSAYPNRAARMRAAILEPLIQISGTGPKVWSMILAELLLGADPSRERWVATGASFVAVDSLVHAYLSRTGVLRRLDAEHRYGSACYETGGCADVISGLADHIDACEFDPDFPARFPRWVQFSIWWFCAADGLGICNGNKIEDRLGCWQRFCPSFSDCDRLPIGP